MYILTGLPIDTKIDDEHLVTIIRGKIPQTELFHLPKFQIKHFDNLLATADALDELNKKINDCFIEYVNMREICGEKSMRSLDYEIKTFEWSLKKFEVDSIDELVTNLKERFDCFSESFNQRASLHNKLKKSIIQRNKEVNGSLREIDIEIKEHDFLAEHYVIVNKEQTKEFSKFISSLKEQEIFVSSFEEILKEKENVLYSLLGLKNNVVDFRKILADKGFAYKKGFLKEEYDKRKLDRENECQEYKIVKSNLILFMNSNEDEIFSLMMYAKHLKLYVETVLYYGLGDTIFFCLKGKKRKIMNEWRRIVVNWRYSKKVSRDLNEDDLFPYVFVDEDEDDDE